MYTLVAIIILLLVFLALASLYSVFKSRIQFFITGLDSGFNLADLSLLWNVAQICELDQPTALFYSLPALTRCMSQITNQALAEGTDKSPKIQNILSKLFDYRTKIQHESDDKKGITSTQYLDKGQKLRIILPGKGVFATEIVNNGNMIVINVPKQKNLIPITGEEWVGKTVSVYLWRKRDAKYVFDTTVTQSGLFLGKSALFLKHSSNLVRTQKRKSVRAKCEIYGNLFIIKNSDSENVDYSTIETKNGYRCLLEDISESGALIRIGGKGVQNIKIKLQYSIQSKLIIMVGVVRTVEFNETENESLLHFECTHIDPVMRNEVLSYVYNMLPESEKEVLEALEQTESDSEQDPVSADLSINNLAKENKTVDLSKTEAVPVQNFEANTTSMVSAPSSNQTDDSEDMDEDIEELSEEDRDDGESDKEIVEMIDDALPSINADGTFSK